MFKIGYKLRLSDDEDMWGDDAGEVVVINEIDGDGYAWFSSPSGGSPRTISLFRIANGHASLLEDVVTPPSHYTQFGAEVIEIAGYLNFSRGNAVKYIARAGSKDPDKELEDLRKAKWYLEWEIRRLEAQNGEAWATLVG